MMDLSSPDIGFQISWIITFVVILVAIGGELLSWWHSR